MRESCTVSGSSSAWFQPECMMVVAMRTGFSMPSSRALRSLIITAAAAPSPMGEHIERVRGSTIIAVGEDVLDAEHLVELGVGD